MNGKMEIADCSADVIGIVGAVVAAAAFSFRI
jgi:hypothetical protein